MIGDIRLLRINYNSDSFFIIISRVFNSDRWIYRVLERLGKVL